MLQSFSSQHLRAFNKTTDYHRVCEKVVWSQFGQCLSGRGHSGRMNTEIRWRLGASNPYSLLRISCDQSRWCSSEAKYWRHVTKDVIRISQAVWNTSNFGEVELYLQFRKWYGDYPMHCHSVVYEDHTMMVCFKVAPPIDSNAGK